MATRQWLNSCKACGHDFTITVEDVREFKATSPDTPDYQEATDDDIANIIEICKPCAEGPAPRPDPLDPAAYDAAAVKVAEALRNWIYEQEGFQDVEMELVIEHGMLTIDADEEGPWQEEFERATDAVYEQLFPPVTLAKRLIGYISAFDEACTNNEETDIGESWDLLYEIRSTLSRLASPRIENERENQGASWRTTTKEVPSG